MRMFLRTFIETAHAALQKPDELPGFAGKSNDAYVVPVLAALSTSVAAYLLRDYYESIFLFNIVLVTLFQAAAYIASGLLFASLVDMFVQQEHPERGGRARGAYHIYLYCLLPLVFTFPAAAIARVTPAALFVAGIFSLLLHVWMILNLLRALQFYYEIPMKSAISSVVRAALVTIGFPGVVICLAALRLISSV